MRRFNQSYLYIFILLTTITLNYIYYYSGNQIGLFYTKYQLPDANDLNYLLYKSLEGIKWDDYTLKVTWGSSGVMLLLFPFTMFGNFHFLLFLLIPFLLSFIILDFFKLTGIDVNHKTIPVLTLSLIGSFTYIGIPGKGFLTFLAFYFFIKGLFNRRAIFFLLAGTISFFNRPWEIIVFLMSLILVNILQHRNGKRYFISLMIIFVFIFPVIFELLIDLLDIELITVDLWQINFERYPYLASDNLFYHLLLTPIRILAVIFSLLSSSMGSFKEINNLFVNPTYFLWRNLPLILRLSSFFFFILISLKWKRVKISFKSNKISKILLIYSLIYASMISLNGVQEKSRYLLIFPVVLFPLLCYRKKE